MDVNDLTPEQRAKAIACKTTEELVELAKEYGIELTDEQLDGIAGGIGKDWAGNPVCPECGERVNTYSDGTYWCPYCDSRGSK